MLVGSLGSTSLFFEETIEIIGEIIKMTEEKKETQETKSTAKSTAKKAPAKPKIDNDTEVLVYNNTTGYLKYVAKKGNGYLELAEFMDSDYMTFEELQQMRNSPHKRMLEAGWIYVDDEDVLDKLNLGKLKEKVKSPQFLKKLIEEGNPKKIIETTEKLSADSKIVLYDIMKKAYYSGEFSNAHVIEEIESLLGVKDPIINK